ncbi:putative arabinan endo-1,5-alpha-L-arabinosidase A [Podospora fimiseda]|uniref:Arabinan endo-1,5-alpha-L-arabinosidase n=1 Tax=Podospora fimiseda TaxID=252190 RepID=A0AAN7BE64_9PEZI|nr:putative arabinan endo-1,5-alpha-L-arabinosidase A [Podospora fimiseda]
MITISLIWGISLLSTLTSGYALPEPCSGVCVNTHDPSIIRHSDGTYFRFSTGGRIAIHAAPTLNGPWIYKGAAIPRGSSINLPGNQDLWAPEISRHNSTHYHLFYSVSTFGSQTSAIGLAISPSLDINTWTDLGSINLSSSPSSKTPYNAIDPSLIYDQANTSYLTFGSFWKGIYLIPLSYSTTTSKFTVTSSNQAIQLAFDPSDAAIEGPNIYFKNGFFYLFFSKGACCGYDRSRPAKGKEYRIMVCRSTNLTGVYRDKNGRDCRNGGGTVVLESHGWVYGPGGQGIIEGEGGRPVMYYHYVDSRVGFADGQKRLGWNWVTFDVGGWPVVV